jgi:hypothetical protein
MHASWQADRLADLAWRQWDGEFVVHHALSNDTHRLSELAGVVLIRLNERPGPWTVEALVADCGADAEDVELALQQLAGIGFVHAC